jgi:agmatinase
MMAWLSLSVPALAFFACVSRVAADGSYDHGRLDLPFVGHCTFGKFPPLLDWEKLSESPADFAVLGVPNDMGTQWRSGARMGPRSVREASTLYSFGHKEVYDADTDETYAYGDVVDVGDVDIVHTDIMTSHNRTQKAVELILNAGKTPFIIGGDHSITAPHCAALAKLGKPITLIQIDAHLDFVDERHGVRYGHGNCMRRCLEMPHIAKMIQLGIRGVSSTAKNGFDDAKRMGSTILSVRKVREIGVEAVAQMIPSDSLIYISIDIDGLDPSIAIGTGTPSHGGFLYYEVKDLLNKIIARSKRLVGLDLVEVSPPYDNGQVTATLAARLLLDAMGFANAKQQLKLEL